MRRLRRFCQRSRRVAFRKRGLQREVRIRDFLRGGVPRVNQRIARGGDVGARDGDLGIALPAVEKRPIELQENRAAGLVDVVPLVTRTQRTHVLMGLSRQRKRSAYALGLQPTPPALSYATNEISPKTITTIYELLHTVLGSVDSFEGISGSHENSWIWSFLAVL